MLNQWSWGQSVCIFGPVGGLAKQVCGINNILNILNKKLLQNFMARLLWTWQDLAGLGRTWQDLAIFLAPSSFIDRSFMHMQMVPFHPLRFTGNANRFLPSAHLMIRQPHANPQHKPQTLGRPATLPAGCQLTKLIQTSSVYRSRTDNCHLKP